MCNGVCSAAYLLAVEKMGHFTRKAARKQKAYLLVVAGTNAILWYATVVAVVHTARVASKQKEQDNAIKKLAKEIEELKRKKGE